MPDPLDGRLVSAAEFDQDGVDGAEFQRGFTVLNAVFGAEFPSGSALGDEVKILWRTE